MDFVSGEILYIDKPLGWTSFDVVKRVRGTLLRRMKLKRFKVGHAGTLDPLATGVMIITTGRSTKRIEELQAGVKEYVATIALGATTPSYDLETEIDATYPTAHITRELVLETLKKFHGTIEQTPPSFSACKIDGHRAYKMARKGQEVELKPKALTIDELTFTPLMAKASARTTSIPNSRPYSTYSANPSERSCPKRWSYPIIRTSTDNFSFSISTIKRRADKVANAVVKSNVRQ